MKPNLQLIKHIFSAVGFLAIASLTVNCKRSEDRSTAAQLEELKSDAKASAQEMKDYSFAEKSQFVAKIQGQLDALNADLERLAARIENSSDAVKADAKPKLQALRNEAKELNSQLDQARNANESTWDTVKANSQKAFASLEDGFQQSRKWVSDKIAP